MSAVEVEKKAEDGKEEILEKGELLFCGGTGWDIIGRRKGSVDRNLTSPSSAFSSIDNSAFSVIRRRNVVIISTVNVATASCHCVALDVEGRCYTRGRNEKGQLGHGDKLQRDRPTVLFFLPFSFPIYWYKFVKAGASKSHTIVVTEEGHSLSFVMSGLHLNPKWSRRGYKLIDVDYFILERLNYISCSEVTTTACGGDFTVWTASVWSTWSWNRQ